MTRAAGEGVTLATNALLPKRDKATKALHFADFPNFRPNLTPDEVIKLGSFGGTSAEQEIRSERNRTAKSRRRKVCRTRTGPCPFQVKIFECIQLVV